MKQVFKCDHCHETSEASSVIEAHESVCVFNPAIKGCFTCEHHEDEGMPISGSMYVCQKGKSWDEQDEIEDKGGCDIWESDKD